MDFTKCLHRVEGKFIGIISVTEQVLILRKCLGKIRIQNAEYDLMKNTEFYPVLDRQEVLKRISVILSTDF